MYRVYQVLPNDTLESIAKKTNSSIEELLKTNGLSESTKIVPGTFIVVPSSPLKFDSYIIQKGDTIYSVASKYDVSPNDLLILNGLNKNDYIYPNDVLLVPRKGYGFYVTKENDTLNQVVDITKNNANDLSKENETIYLKKDQLIIYKDR